MPLVTPKVFDTKQIASSEKLYKHLADVAKEFQYKTGLLIVSANFNWNLAERLVHIDLKMVDPNDPTTKEEATRKAAAHVPKVRT